MSTGSKPPNTYPDINGDHPTPPRPSSRSRAAFIGVDADKDAAFMERASKLVDDYIAPEAPLPPFAVHFVKPVFAYGKEQTRPTSMSKYREDDAAMRGTPYVVEALGVRFGVAPLDSFVPWSNITCCGRGL